MSKLFYTLLSLLSLLTLCSSVSIDSWSRVVDASSQLVRISDSVVFKGAPPPTFEFVLDAELAENVAHIEATDTRRSNFFRVTRKSGNSYTVDLKGLKDVLHVETVLVDALQPLPKAILQKENQLVTLNFNAYVLSPYNVGSQSTKFTLASTKVESFDKKPKPVEQSSNTVVYGPYEDVKPYSEEMVQLHFENNNAFLSVMSLERQLQVSLWGTISVEETVDLVHSGARLRGAFSRYDFQRENAGVASVKSFKTVLPASASDVYYRDDIGNISTSALRQLSDSVEVELRPRFPLFGGWKTHYVLGYNVPSYEYLYQRVGDSSSYVLNMRLVDHVHDDMAIKSFRLRIVLPEGVQVGKLSLPFDVKREKDEKLYSFLDVEGRTVVVLTNLNTLTEKHIEDFQLEFKLPRYALVREPLMLVLAFFLFFVLTIIYVRLDFSIRKDENSEAKMKLAGLCEKLGAILDKRELLYSKFDDLLSKLKTSKDNGAFATASKRLAADHKTETQNISDLNATIKALSIEVADKVADIQQLDRNLRDQQTMQSGLVEKFLSGKLARPQFVEQEAVVVRKKDETLEKINAIREALKSF